MDHCDPDVDAWFEAYDNPHRELVQEVRRTILDADALRRLVVAWI